MRLNKYFIPMLPMLAVGCAGLTGQQAPAPVEPYYKTPVPQPPKPIVKQKPVAPPEVKTAPSLPSAPPAWATPAEKVQSTQLSPVAIAMISDADRSAGAGNLDSAAAVLERGLRIEPRNATLIYKLAEVRLKQAKPKQAEDLAKKSAILAGSDNALKKRCWLLIAEAKKIQGDLAGAMDAHLKAGSF
ncbi:tetratricopeptide repeat protein [Methylotuvimicrobium buryatense]|uniref:Tetratricopeptide repeat protein n=2 Tax=Methylotuvimicrobium buryatense TaxID=95641 RepID=A0A4V1IJM6_METBY|nr:tetratricopeptide repeat protein [Methylotuvimicrobium buryatense]QCW81935.1 tetratricopeptide repeat protein [Methylotuvimicrobium buryatense]